MIVELLDSVFLSQKTFRGVARYGETVAKSFILSVYDVLGAREE